MVIDFRILVIVFVVVDMNYGILFFGFFMIKFGRWGEIIVMIGVSCCCWLVCCWWGGVRWWVDLKCMRCIVDEDNLFWFSLNIEIDVDVMVRVVWVVFFIMVGIG